MIYIGKKRKGLGDRNIYIDKESQLEYLIIRLFYSGITIYSNYISKGLRFKRTGRLR